MRKVSLFFLIFSLLIGMCHLSGFCRNQDQIQQIKQSLRETQGVQRIKLLQNLAILYADTLPDKSIYYAQESIQISEDSTIERADALYFLGNIYRRFHKYQLALEYHQQALNIREIAKQDYPIATSLNNLGEIYKILNNKQEALKNFHASLKLREKLGNLKQIAYTLNNIGNVHWMSQDFEKALEYYLKALEIRTQIGDKTDISSSLNNMGNVYRTLKKYNKALNYYLKALEIRKGLNNQTLIAYTLNDIGGIYWRLDNFNEALKYYNQSLLLRQKLDQKRYIASTHKNIGTVYKDLNELNYSLTHYTKALEIYTQLKDTIEMAISHAYIGNLYRDYNNFEKSLEYYQTSLSLNKKIHNPQGIARTSHNIGEILVEYKGKKEAKPYFVMAFEQAYLTNNLSLRKKTSVTLSKLFSKEGDYKKALKYYQQFSQTQHDSMVTQLNNDRISKIEAKYQINKSKNEISNLKEFNRHQTLLIYLFISIIILTMIIGYITYKNSQIRKATALTLAKKNQELEEINSRIKQSELMLKDMNITKDKFFTVISRDLRDPFQELTHVSSELYLRFDHLSKQKKLQYSKTLKSLSKHSYTLVENLLLWASSQTGRTRYNPITLNIGQMIDNTIAKLEGPIDEKKLEIVFHLPTQISCYADPKALVQVLRNLLTNAIKFSYPKGKIVISALEKKFMIEMKISDQGVGISPGNLNKIFRMDSNYLAMGTAQEKGSGIGLLLCKEYVEKSGGKIWAHSEEGKGSSFFFTLPKNQRLSQSSHEFHLYTHQNNNASSDSPTPIKTI